MILVYGTLCLDRVRHVYALPSKGGYAEVLSQSELLGGAHYLLGVLLEKDQQFDVAEYHYRAAQGKGLDEKMSNQIQFRRAA